MKNLKTLAFIFVSLCSFFASGQTWMHVGPISNTVVTNKFETGRLDCVAPDAGFDGVTNKTLYAGSTSGSLWKTTDLGSSWNPVVIPNSVTYHGISALETTAYGFLVATVNTGAIANNNGNIYKYNTSSNAWLATSFAAVSSSAYVNHIRMSPVNPLVIFVAASNGLYRSTNGGTNWIQLLTGTFENVEFVPSVFATNGYAVYACGDNTIVASDNLGFVWVPKINVTSLLTPGFYADMSATFDATSTNTRFIYFDVIDGGVHHVLRLNTDINTTTESVVDYGLISDIGLSSDRMCTAAYDQSVYFGNGGWTKLNAVDSKFYYINGGTEFQISYVNYGTPGHPDAHDALIFPSLNLIVYVNDGGCFIDNYTPGAGNINVNIWQKANDGLNISQIWGLSCAEEDVNEFMTGEQDTKAFLTTSPGATPYANGTEPSIVLIDLFNKNNYMHSSVASSSNIVGTFNGLGFSSVPQGPNTVGGNICNSVPIPGSWFPSPEFGSTTLFQDPNRPDKIFFGTKNNGLFEFCPGTRIFTGKNAFTGTYQQFVNGMAFSRANKNKVVALLSNRDVTGDNQEPRVFRFTGIDFDNSWMGFNDGPANWQDITPNFTLPPFTNPVTLPLSAKIQFVGVAISDWIPDKVWVATRYVPGNPNLKVLFLDAGATTWIDYSAGIPVDEIPISLVYEQGTNDQMYLGTNVNVYYRNASMSSWAPYSGNLPNIAMNQLKINYKENTVRAGTYGQGMWKSSLQCPTVQIDVEMGVVTTDQFIEAEQYILANNVSINGNQVIYRAGEYIELLPDFEAIPSPAKMFYAFIHGCNSPGNTFREPNTGLPLYEEEEIEIDADLNKNESTIYPNPGTGVFTMENPFEEEGLIEVYSADGKLVLSKTVRPDVEFMFDITNEPAGIYYAKLTSGAKFTFTSFMKQ